MNPNPDLTIILAKLPMLTERSELEQVKLRLDALLSTTTTKSIKTRTLHVDWLTEGIIGEMRRRGLVAKKHVDPFRPDSYANSVTEVQAWLLTKSSRALTPPEKLLLGSIVAHALADFLPTDKSPLTLRRMFYAISRVGEALEWAFPGYLQSGMLDFLIRTGRK